MGGGEARAPHLKFLEFLPHLVVKVQIVVLLVVGDDLIGIEISIFQLLVVGPTLQRIARADKFGHFFV
jgi:hypothetical protein